MEQKKQRTFMKANFTRKLNVLAELMDESAQTFLVEEAYEKFKTCWEKLEESQEAFIMASDIDIENHPDGLKYMDAEYERYNAMLKRYSSYLKTSEESERVQSKRQEEDDRAAEKVIQQEEVKAKFLSEASKLELAIDTFERTNANFQDLIGEASASDKRKEWQIIEDEFSSLKSLLVSVKGLDATQDTTAINTKFVDVAEKAYTDTKRWVMQQLKDSVQEMSTIPVTNNNHTRNEKVTLPEFKGGEKDSPYLKYPTWRKQWDI